MNAQLVLNAALALATLGMSIIALAVIAPKMFFAGVYLLDAAFVGMALAGVLYLLAAREPA